MGFTSAIGSKFKNLNRKVIRCPQCSKQLRVPVRPGKTLRVTCARCHGQFDMAFKNPVTEVFQWTKGYSMAHNMKFMMTRFKMLPMNAKASLVLFIFTILLLLDLLIAQGLKVTRESDFQNFLPGSESKSSVRI